MGVQCNLFCMFTRMHVVVCCVRVLSATMGNMVKSHECLSAENTYKNHNCFRWMDSEANALNRYGRLNDNNELNIKLNQIVIFVV